MQVVGADWRAGARAIFHLIVHLYSTVSLLVHYHALVVHSLIGLLTYLMRQAVSVLSGADSGAGRLLDLVHG